MQKTSVEYVLDIFYAENKALTQEEVFQLTQKLNYEWLTEDAVSLVLRRAVHEGSLSLGYLLTQKSFNPRCNWVKKEWFTPEVKKLIGTPVLIDALQENNCSFEEATKIDSLVNGCYSDFFNGII